MLVDFRPLEEICGQIVQCHQSTDVMQSTHARTATSARAAQVSVRHDLHVR